jgi:hypothetical protein
VVGPSETDLAVPPVHGGSASALEDKAVGVDPLARGRGHLAGPLLSAGSTLSDNRTLPRLYSVSATLDADLVVEIAPHAA